MPTYTVTSPDGKQWDVNAPEGATQDQVLAYAKSQWSAQQKAPEAPPAEPDSIGRQAGLFARSAMTGLAGVPQILTEPIRQLVTNPLARVAGLAGGEPLTAEANKLANLIGLPQPQNRAERIVDKGVEMGMGAAGLAGLAGLARSATQSPVTQKLLDSLSANPGTQAISGAAGGLAGQHAKENGADWQGQFASTILGGLAGAGGMAAAKGAAGWASNALRPGLAPQAVDQHITNILVQQGIDPASIGPALLSKMRADVSKAMKVGGNLDENAIARLADYSRIGATPTRAGVTLDPYDVTMQRNAEKLAAATGARDARLPQISQSNNQRLIDTVQGMGPNADLYGAGSRVVGDIAARNAAMGAEKSALYTAARDMAGGDIPVDRGVFTQSAFRNLARENKLAFLPENIGTLLNQISKGVVSVNGQQHEVPFTVQTIDMLKTMLAAETRGTSNGNVRAALGIVRDALERTPVAPTKAMVGGSQLVGPEGASFMQMADSQAGNLLGALDKARAAAAAQFRWQESAPGIEAALGGSVPAEGFIRRYVISSAAGADDVGRLAASLTDEGRSAVRGSIVQHLLESSTSRGRDAGASNFNGPQLMTALKAIGDRKLGVFFTPDEIESLKSAARVGGFETLQPRGSAVNNSNTAAAAGSMLEGLSKKVKMLPFGPTVINPPLDALALKMATRPALNVSGGLLGGAGQQGSFADGLLGPALYGSGLLSAP